jgi:hypothetical protein
MHIMIFPKENKTTNHEIEIKHRWKCMIWENDFWIKMQENITKVKQNTW